MNVFHDVIGHGSVLAMLDREIASPTQSYLFVGPAGIGKATIARRFAAALVAGNDADATRRAIAATHPDVILVEPEGRTALTVDQARSTVARASRAPVEAARKVFLIEEAGSMNDEAANALLKTLEEPTATTVFVLVAEAEDQLPPTIGSRCRTIYFGRVADEEIVAALRATDVDAAQAERAALAAAGRPGLALAFATNPDVVGFRKAWLGVPGRLSTRPGDAMRLAEEMAKSPDPLLKAVAERHARELAALGEGAEGLAKTVKERHDRELRRAAAALHVIGLEVLASWYRDAAAAPYGAPARNRGISGVELSAVEPRDAVSNALRVLDTVASLEANQRPELALAALFADLGTA